MEKLMSPKMRHALKEYTRWYYRNFLPLKQYTVFLKIDGGKMCIYFSYDLTEQIDECVRKCKKDDDCFMECYEDVVDAAEEFLAEQSYAFEKQLKKRGIGTTFEYSWDWSGNGKAVRWTRLCLPRV